MPQRLFVDRRVLLAYLAAGARRLPERARRRGAGGRRAGEPGAGGPVGRSHRAAGASAASLQMAVPGRALERGRAGQRPDRAARFAAVRRRGAVRLGRRVRGGDRRPSRSGPSRPTPCKKLVPELSAACGPCSAWRACPAQGDSLRGLADGETTAWQYANADRYGELRPHHRQVGPARGRGAPARARSSAGPRRRSTPPARRSPPGSSCPSVPAKLESHLPLHRAGRLCAGDLDCSPAVDCSPRCCSPPA